ncbi:MAG: LysR substrate-binding domain-containing protein [Amphritea sp.]
MRLDIRHWEMLKAIAEAGTLRQAADTLGITQSALSHRLAEAERRLGGALFEREGRRLRLTPAGRAMTQTAIQVLPALQRAESDFQQITKKEAAVVRLGVAAYNCYHWLPQFMRMAAREESAIQLELVAAATQNPIRSLNEAAVDVVIAPGHLATPGITATPLFDDQLVLVVPVNHSLSNKSHVNAEDLADEVYLTYSRTTQPGFEYERFIRPSGVIPLQVNVVEMTDAIVELIASGFGVSILSKWAVESALESGRIATVQVGETGLDLGWSALMRESEKESSPTRILSDLLASWYGTETLSAPRTT